ncbi:MAG: hypothetical protein J0H08_06310 [Rhizobiales bacterium]|nr:hypothetical protein [Hyphomicrobiales bacterium]
MKSKALDLVLERIEAWPREAQEELARIALDIDAGLTDQDYAPTGAEHAGIERVLRAAIAGRFASDASVEAVFAKLRRA